MSGAEPALIMAAAEAAAAAAPTAAAATAATALPAAGMAATGGLLGTGATAFGSAAMPALGIEALAAPTLEASLAAGLPAAATPFSTGAAAFGPSAELAGSFMGPSTSLWSGASEVPMADKLGYRVGNLGNNAMSGMGKMFNPQNMMMNGMKMAGQGLLGGQQQPAPAGRPNLQAAQDVRSLVPTYGSEREKQKRDELLKQMMMGMR